MKQTTLVIGALLSAAMIVGCRSDIGPTGGVGGVGGASIIGNYTATQWVTTDGSGQTNQILAGSTLSITLNANGSTNGHLHRTSPAFDADMAGTWILRGSTVDFAQNADTFVRDMHFNVVPSGAKWALDADQVLSGTRIQLTLTQN